MYELGIALSGGGSRAIGFHRGTLRALEKLNLLERVEVVSTVSGGSVFGGAWLRARSLGKSSAQFLDDLVEVLAEGFVREIFWPPRVLKVLVPGWNRTRVLSERFDAALMGKMLLSDLPEKPVLCINTSVLNHGQVGRFSRQGFSCQDVGVREPSGSYPVLPVSFGLALACAASAAFPFGLPPVAIPVEALGENVFQGSLQGHRRLLLTDGGVLENLGVQTLLRSRRFAARSLVVSDAGTSDPPWRPSIGARVRSFLAFAFAPCTLERLLFVMSSKQNRSMRQILMHEMAVSDAAPPRRLLFARIDQTWGTFMEGVSLQRRAELGGGRGIPLARASATDVETFLRSAGVELEEAKSTYEAMGGERGVRRANQIATGFTGLPRPDIALLERHAAWQIFAAQAVYGGHGLP